MSKIDKLMGRSPEAQPDIPWFVKMWRVPLMSPMNIPKLKVIKKIDDGKTVPGSQGYFNKRFRTIEFHEVQSLDNEHLSTLLTAMSNDIDKFLSVCKDEKEVRRRICDLAAGIFNESSEVDPSEEDPKQENYLEYDVKHQAANPVFVFFNFLIQEICGNREVSFSFRQQPFQSRTAGSLWEQFTTDPFPFSENLYKFKYSTGMSEDIAISLSVKDRGAFSVYGEEIKRTVVSDKIQSWKDDDDLLNNVNLIGFKEIFRQCLYYMFGRQWSIYSISDLYHTFYFELPIDESEMIYWEHTYDDSIVMRNSNLRIKVIDNTSSNVEWITHQCLIMVRIFESFRAANFPSKDAFPLTSIPNECAMEKSDVDDVGYKLFMKKILEAGFLDGFPLESGSDNKKSTEDPDGDEKNNEIDDAIVKGPKRRFRQSTIDQSKKYRAHDSSKTKGKGKGKKKSHSNGIGQVRDESFVFVENIDPKSYEILSNYTSLTCLKIILNEAKYISQFRFLKSFNDEIRTRKVFIKLYEMNHIRAILHGRGTFKKNEADQVVLKYIGLMRYHYNELVEKAQWEFDNELKMLRIIQDYNSRVSNPIYKIRCPALLEFGEMCFYVDDDHPYFGPFLAFEYLPFVNRKIENGKQRESFEQQMENLKRAGVEHCDLKQDNLCCDGDDVYLMDFAFSHTIGAESAGSEEGTNRNDSDDDHVFTEAHISPKSSNTTLFM